jgi:hypothetical protein
MNTHFIKMNSEKYSIEVGHDFLTYRFSSAGPNGIIKKVIVFESMDSEDIYYNLAFGDWDEKNQIIDDKAVSNNNDTLKILNTVAFTILDFLENNPSAKLYVEGSTRSRTRLYQINILSFWSEISLNINVLGYYEGRWEAFRQGTNYDAFLATIK